MIENKSINKILALPYLHFQEGTLVTWLTILDSSSHEMSNFPSTILSYFNFETTQIVRWEKRMIWTSNPNHSLLFYQSFKKIRNDILKIFAYINQIICFSLLFMSKYCFCMQDFIVEKREIFWVALQLI